MKFKQTVLLAAFVVTMGLLLGAGATQAATVSCGNNPERPEPCTDETSSVLRIDDLEVTDSGGETTVYTVLFQYDFATGPYGRSLLYDFTNPKDASLAMEAVQEALNSNVPIPASAGPLSNPSFYIGAKTTDKTTTGRILLALGSESFEEGWDECTAENCLNGVTALEDNKFNTYAVFSDGSPKLLSPVGEIDDSEPLYSWRSVENATYYLLWVENSQEEMIYYDVYEPKDVGCDSEEGDSAPGLQCTVTSGDTEPLIDGSYNWWVLSWIPPTDGETNWEPSDPLSFTVTGAFPQP
jgi:hypothetical protein